MHYINIAENYYKMINCLFSPK